MRWPLQIFLVFLAFASVAIAQQPNTRTRQAADENVATARRAVEAQAEAWNRGDLTGFLESYAKEDSTTFVGTKGAVRRGWQQIRDSYKETTPDKMGTLTFSDVELTPLSESYILGMGQWQLAVNGEARHGRFTVILHHTAGGWRIFYDHLASTP